MKTRVSFKYFVTDCKSKVHEKNTSRETALNFNQWQIFLESYKALRAWLWNVNKIKDNYFRLRHEFHSNSSKIFYFLWQDRYSSLNTICHIEPKAFLWIKLLKNVLLAKYLLSKPIYWDSSFIKDWSVESLQSGL